MRLRAGNRLGIFEILAPLGKGGMGEVYRARDTKLGREVAVKTLPKEMSDDPDRVARFAREARTLVSLQHANIASVYGYEEIEGDRFLVMELAQGEDLAARLERGAIPPEEAVDIALQLAAGLEAAHDLGIVHRDLKPANIKLTSTHEVKILDFGLARAYLGDGSEETDNSQSPTMSSVMTKAGVILGTGAYMSPEQASGRPLDHRSDIWSFGVVLFEMLTGRRAFGGDTVAETIASVLRDEPDLGLLPATTPSGIRSLLECCFRKKPRERLRHIGDARFLLDKPPPPGGGVRRHESRPLTSPGRCRGRQPLARGGPAPASEVRSRHRRGRLGMERRPSALARRFSLRLHRQPATLGQGSR